jgi:dTDP-4-amino-4,6-dideoxygalactose transaminase
MQQGERRMSSRESLPVPFFDWRALFAERADAYTRIISDTAAMGGFILQGAVDEFEIGLEAYLGVGHAIGVSNGTDAMLLGLRASGLKAGAEVILPAHCFIAAAQAIHFAGGRPVPVECSPEDGLISPEAVERAITPATGAIMVVHVNGRVCAMDEILQIAGRHGLPVFEDAAQALGARLEGRPAGRFGAWGAFSFYPSKTLGCFGDAGALVTDDDDLARRLRAMRNHGSGPDKAIAADCAEWGTNARIDNIQAAILAYKLGWYDETLARRREIAARYDAAFRDLDGLELPPAPDSEPGRFDIFQNYEVCCDRRDELRAHLLSRGVGTIVQWGGVALHQFRNLGFDQHLPRADRWAARSLLLPMNHLLSDDQVDRTVAAVSEFFA